MSDLVSQTSKVIKEVIKSNKNHENGLFFLHKILLHIILNPPYPQFSTQLFNFIFLGNFIQIFARFDFRLHLILNPRGTIFS